MKFVLTSTGLAQHKKLRKTNVTLEDDVKNAWYKGISIEKAYGKYRTILTPLRLENIHPRIHQGYLFMFAHIYPEVIFINVYKLPKTLR